MLEFRIEGPFYQPPLINRILSKGNGRDGQFFKWNYKLNQVVNPSTVGARKCTVHYFGG